MIGNQFLEVPLNNFGCFRVVQKIFPQLPLRRLCTLQSYAHNITFDDFNLVRTVSNSGKTSKTVYDFAGRLIKEEQNTSAGLNTVN